MFSRAKKSGSHSRQARPQILENLEKFRFFFQISRFAGIRGATCLLILVDKLDHKFWKILKILDFFFKFQGLPEFGVQLVYYGIRFF